MHRFKRRKRAVVGVLATAATAIFLLPVSQAGAVTTDNACINTANPAAASFVPIDLTATASPNPVSPGGTVTLSNITNTATVPSAIFLAGYRLLGPPFIVVGQNSFPVTVRMVIEGTNTVEGTQTTNMASGVVTTTITDPTPADRNNGDESATPGSLTITFADQTWTAGASGTIEFREDTVTPLSVAGTGTGGMVIDTVVGGIISVRFACSPGTVVEGADPSTIVFTDPAATFASTQIVPPNLPPVANAGPDQTVHSGTVNLNGTGSSDPNGDPLTFSWSQTGGTPVTLTGANTATPSFTAPTTTGDLTFELTVCDPAPLCSTDSVVITVVNGSPTANAGPDQTVANGTTVNLTGAGSSDPDGDTLTFAWTQTGGNQTVTLNGANTATPSFTAPPNADVLTFQLQVCDPFNACSTDSVVITVTAPVFDAAGLVIVNGPVTSAKTSKSFVFKVSNTGTAPITVNPLTDIISSVDVNGVPTGSVTPNSGTKTLSPGASTRVKLVWSYDALLATGNSVVFHACVNVAGDPTPADNCDDETATAK